MRVLLIQPPFTILRTEAKKCHPPLGLAYLAAAIKDGFEVAVVDALAEGYKTEEDVDGEYLRYGLAPEGIKERVSSFSPDVVGVSCLFSAQAQNAHEICRIVKETDKGIITVMGGMHPTAAPREVLDDRNVDFIIAGEGELSFKGLLQAIEAKKDTGNVEGAGFMSAAGPKINPRAGYNEDLDAYPFPYWDIFPLEKYFKINNPHGGAAKRAPFLPVITSRGCPFECVFCSVHNLWGRGYRKRSAGNILNELSRLISRFGVREVLFEDDNLTFDKSRAKQIFEGMKDKKMDLTWSTPNGVAIQALDEELLGLMKESGCYSISIGVESGDERILKDVIRKPIELSRVKPLVRRARQLGLHTAAFFVVGLPGEDKGSLARTFRFAEGLDADNINFFFATPLPGTRLLDLCLQGRLIGEKLDYKKLKSDKPYFGTGPLSKEALASLVNSERLKLYILSFLAHPVRFLRRLCRKFKYFKAGDD